MLTATFTRKCVCVCVHVCVFVCVCLLCRQLEVVSCMWNEMSRQMCVSQLSLFWFCAASSSHRRGNNDLRAVSRRIQHLEYNFSYRLVCVCVCVVANHFFSCVGWFFHRCDGWLSGSRTSTSGLNPAALWLTAWIKSSISLFFFCVWKSHQVSVCLK